MEDFSTILWIVIIVGAMIYNTLSKARKTRGKAENTPMGHGEAWPSIPWNEEKPTPTLPEDIPDSRMPASAPSNPSTPPTESLARNPDTDDRSPQTGTAPNDFGRSSVDTSHRTFHTRNDHRVLQTESNRKLSAEASGKALHRKISHSPLHAEVDDQVPKPVFEAFPDENQRLEEIPLDVYVPEYEAVESPDHSEYEPSTPRRLRSDVQRQSPDKNKITSETPPKKNRRREGNEESLTELIEEFDLRRAVIYSEILKPKFEE